MGTSHLASHHKTSSPTHQAVVMEGGAEELAADPWAMEEGELTSTHNLPAAISFCTTTAPSTAVLSKPCPPANNQPPSCFVH
eukprot:13644747-Ditylum_brightwellii.AAC.1